MNDKTNKRSQTNQRVNKRTNEQTNDETIDGSMERWMEWTLPPFVVSVDQQEIVMNATIRKRCQKAI